MNPSDPLSSLSAVDRRVLESLLQQRGRVASRQTLMRLAAVESLTSRRIDVCIVALRRALGPGSITTVRQRGWMLTESGINSAENLLSSQIDRQP